jgi:hypothetical protein
MESKSEPALTGLYQQTADRKNWDDPNRTEIVKSLNKAHSVNKVLIANLDQALRDLVSANEEIKALKRWVKWLLWCLLASWGVVGYIVKFLLPFAVKGMVH